MKLVGPTLGAAVVLLVALFLPSSMRAQDQDKFNVFGGYSYFHASVTDTGVQLCPGPTCGTLTLGFHPNLNGWDAGVDYKAFKDIGLVADFGGYYGSLPNSSVSLHTSTYLFGPRVSFPGRISPFVHVLAGAAHQSFGSGSTGSNGGVGFPAHSTNAFAIDLGGGVDVDLTQRFRIRLVQLDYIGFHSGLGFRNQARISTGLVFHF